MRAVRLFPFRPSGWVVMQYYAKANITKIFDAIIPDLKRLKILCIFGDETESYFRLCFTLTNICSIMNTNMRLYGRD